MLSSLRNVWAISCRLHGRRAPNPLPLLPTGPRTFASCTSSSSPSHPTSACRNHPNPATSPTAGTVQSSGSNKYLPQGASGRPTLAQLDAAFQVYRHIMRVHRRVLQKPTARKLADAFVKNEFRLHMAAASAEINKTFLEERCRDTAAGKGAEDGKNPGTSSSNREDPPKCTEAQFHQFLKAWEEYIQQAIGEATPLHVGRSLKPSQRKLLTEEQLEQLKKLKSLAVAPPAPK